VIKGFATAAGTEAYRARLGEAAVDAHFRSWDGLRVSSLGVGTYLGSEDAAADAAYRAAVSRAVELGVNVIDSAINYRHQRSEKSVGAALADLTSSGRVRREELVLATKGGFIPFDGAAPPDPTAYVEETYVRPGIAKRWEVVGGVHCIAPRFLSDQLDRSRANLGVDTIDVYYLHNPETQLAEVDRPTFLGRMRTAFAFLEAAVAEGRIRVYGTATWTGYRQAAAAADLLSLPDLVRVARELAGEGHHFRVVQLPYNLGMTEAFTLANQSSGGGAVSALEAARQLGLFAMTSASIHQGQLARNLPAVIAEFLPGLRTDAQRALQFARSTPGVGTALAGMKRLAHVEENAELRGVAPVPWEEFSRLFSGA